MRPSHRQVGARARISKHEGSRLENFVISSTGIDMRGPLLSLAAGDCIVAACAGSRWRSLWYDKRIRRMTVITCVKLAFVILWILNRLSADWQDIR